MIPVRGGSQGVPRKNARTLGDRPLIAHVLTTLKTIDPDDQIFVLTDDDELEAIALSYGVRVFKTGAQSGKETLDDKAIELLPTLKKAGAKQDDIFLTIQATCPFVKASTIKKAKTILNKKSCVITAMDDRHLTWTTDAKGAPIPEYTERVNRQLLPDRYRESGAVIGARIKDIAKHKTRIIEPIGLLPIQPEEGLDIDDFKEWAIAEYLVLNKKVFIRADAGKKLGMGHVYRALAIAQELAKYRPVFVTQTSAGKNLGAKFFKEEPFDLIEVKNDDDFVRLSQKEKPDLIILDQLDTDPSYIKKLKKSGAKIITFEDMGRGALEADLLVSDLYENPYVTREKQLSGVRFTIMAPAFERIQPKESIDKTVKNILILFGGTDPANLAEKSLQALKAAKYKGNVTVIQGLGRQNRDIDLKKYGLKGEVLTNIKYMPGVMRQADLAFSSAGRTITELLTLAIPTLCLCQNEKELTHTHASQAYGVLNLGLGELLGEQTLVNNINFLLKNHEFRKHMHQRAKVAVKGHTNQIVMKRMLEKIGMSL